VLSIEFDLNRLKAEKKDAHQTLKAKHWSQIESTCFQCKAESLLIHSGFKKNVKGDAH
jgi:hypothetical protein